MGEHKQYVRIGNLWHCRECDEDLVGWWAIFKHDWLHHAWEGRRLRALIDRLRRRY